MAERKSVKDGREEREPDFLYHSDGLITESTLIEDGEVTHVTLGIALKDSPNSSGLLIFRIPTERIDAELFGVGQTFSVYFPSFEARE